MATQTVPESPRLARLLGELQLRTPGALDTFWSEVSECGTPLIEAVAGDQAQTLVTYLWRGDDDTRTVVAETPFDTGDPSECQMACLPGTDVWYRTYRGPSDLRVSYHLSPNDPLIPWNEWAWDRRVATWQPDPFNRGRRITIGPADDEAPQGDPRGLAWVESTVELASARRDEWSAPRPGVPTGQVRLHRLPSSRLLPCEWLEPPLRQTRRVWVYSPAYAFPSGQPHALVLLFDGYDYLHYVQLPTILDNLLAARHLPPLVAVLLDTPNRQRFPELNGSPAFVEAIAADVVPWVRQHYPVTADPALSVVGGLSLGGLGAAFVALCHPELFGNILSQSGAFWPGKEDDPEPEWLARHVASRDPLPVRWFLEAGRLETWQTRRDAPSLLVANRHLRTVLQAKGYAARYQEFGGGHSHFCWQVGVSDGLIALLGAERD